MRTDSLRTALSALGPVRRRALLLETLGDVAGGSHSVPELDFVAAVRRAGLPLPRRQAQVRRDDGTWYLDAEWEDFALVVEVDGAQHAELLAREADDVRRNALEVGGRRVLRFSSWQLRHRRDESMALLRQGLVAGGWSADDALVPAAPRQCQTLRAS